MLIAPDSRERLESVRGWGQLRLGEDREVKQREVCKGSHRLPLYGLGWLLNGGLVATVETDRQKDGRSGFWDQQDRTGIWDGSAAGMAPCCGANILEHCSREEVDELPEVLSRGLHFTHAALRGNAYYDAHFLWYDSQATSASLSFLHSMPAGRWR